MTEQQALPLIRPHLCKPIKRPEVAIKPGRKPGAFHIEPKYDGFRVLGNINTSEDVLLYTRTQHQLGEHLPWVASQLGLLFPYGTIVDGEIVAITRNADGTVNNNFDFVQGVCNSYPDRAQALQADFRPLEYRIFDLVYLCDEDLQNKPLADRRKKLEGFFKDRFSPQVKLTPIARATYDNYAKLVGLGYEGAVVKDRTTIYRQERRGWGWWKLKNQLEVDVVIMGFDPGTGQFEDTFGALRFGQYYNGSDEVELIYRGSCSGMDVSTRHGMWEEGEKLVGQVMTIAHMGVYPDGHKFRHPQYRRLRTDKLAKDCGWDNGMTPA